MFQIGEFSKMSKTPIKTLRYYDEIELLKPEYVDKQSGYRFYSTDQLVKLHTIQAFKQLGCEIKEIQKFFIENNREEMLNARKMVLLEEKNKLEKQLLKVEFLLSNKEEEEWMSYEAIIKETPAGIAYTKRMHLSGYEEYFEKIPALGEEMMDLNPTMKGGAPEYCFIIHTSGEYREKDMDIQFFETVDKEGIAPEGVRYVSLDSCKVISVMHRGKYEDLGVAYAYGLKWANANGYKVNGHIRENYIDGIWNKESREDWLTEIQIPIE